MAKTSASFTLMDYTDGISLITGIDSNLPLTSLYDTTTQTLNPSWAESPSLQLTPTVIKAGSATSLIPSMTAKKWYRRISGGEWIEVISGSSGETINPNTGVLVVSQDKLAGDVWQIDYKFTGTYRDPILLLDFPVEIKVTFSRVDNGTSFVVARAYTVDGSQFKNDQPSTLQIKSELIRGTTPDVSNLSYQWYKSINGSTWTALSVASATTATLSVTPSMVDSFAMFRCTITDNDPASETHDQTFTTEGVSILDVSDPYQAVIESTAGSYFKNAVGSTVLICRLYREGTEIDATGEGYSYVWTKTDKNGTLDPTFVQRNTAHGSIVSTNGKAILVDDTDVDVKATFFCTVNDLV